MTPLGQKILALIKSGDYVIGLHATERLDERGILEWQVIEAMDHAIYLRDRPDGVPHPIVEFNIILPDGTQAKVVWGYIRLSQAAKLVTVHYDED